jgi:hypothetical protein
MATTIILDVFDLMFSSCCPQPCFLYWSRLVAFASHVNTTPRWNVCLLLQTHAGKAISFANLRHRHSQQSRQEQLEHTILSHPDHFLLT